MNKIENVNALSSSIINLSTKACIKLKNNEKINSTIYSIYLLIHLLIFSNLNEVRILGPNTLQLNLVQLLIFLSIFAVLLVEIICWKVYGWQYYIGMQYQIYRYGLFSLTLRALISQTINTVYLPTYVAVVLVVIFIVLNAILANFLVWESFREHLLSIKIFSFSFYLLLFEVLLSIYQYSNSQVKVMVLPVLLLISIASYFFMFKNSNFNKIELKLLEIINLTTMFESIYLIQSFSSQEFSKSISICYLILILYLILMKIIKVRIVSYEQLQIFKNTLISCDQLIEKTEKILIQLHYYQHHPSQIQNSCILELIYEHRLNCSQIYCPLLGQETEFQTQNFQQSRNAQNLLHKVFKKIDLIFQERSKDESDNVKFKIAYLKFLVRFTANKKKSIEVLGDLNNFSLSLRQMCEVSKLHMILYNSETNWDDENFQGVNSDISNFTTILTKNLTDLMQFWSKFGEEKIDLNQLSKISLILTSNKECLEKCWKDSFVKESYTSVRIIGLYSKYVEEVLNDYENSSRFEVFLSNLTAKLDQAKDIKFLSNQSEIGLISISLSQRSLGNIISCNSQAQVLFGYPHKQLLHKRVNAIMPDIFSEFHDSLLRVFLKNKNKIVNGDDRIILGKNCAGNIFQFQIRLQKAITSTSDQIIFVANVKKHKNKQISLIAIVNCQGIVTNTSSGYHHFFMNNHLKKKKKRNIKEIIPQFFLVSEPNQLQEQRVISISSYIHSYGLLQFDFVIKPLIFFGKISSYFVKGVITNQNKEEAHENIWEEVDHRSITKAYVKLIEQESVSIFKNSYDNEKNEYNMDKDEEVYDCNTLNNFEFTIPFINMTQIPQILDMKDEKVQYGADIRIIRYRNTHLEPVDDQYSFRSLSYDSEDKIEIQDKMLEINQKSLHNESKTFTTSYKILLGGISLFTIGILILLIFSYQSYVQQKRAILFDITAKYNVRSKLAESMIYAAGFHSKFNNSYYQPRYKNISVDFIQNVMSSSINQDQKEVLLKVAYYTSNANYTSLLNDTILAFTYPNSDQSWLYALWFTVIGILVLYGLFCFFYFKKFQQELIRIYMIFLDLNQDTIYSMYQKCDRFLKVLAIEQGSENSENIPKNTYLKATSDQENINKLRKSKQFKNVNRQLDRVYLLKIFIPAFFMILVGVIGLLIFQTNRKSINSTEDMYIKVYKLIPESSMFFMKCFMQSAESTILNVTDSFTDDFLNIDMLTYQYALNHEDPISQIIPIFAFGNVCETSLVANIADASQCATVGSGILQNGISKILALMLGVVSILRDYPIATLPESFRVSIFNQTIKLHFDNTLPVIQSMGKLILDYCYQQEQIFQNNLIFSILLIIAVIFLNFLFLIFYPINAMNTQLEETKGLVQLISNIKDQNLQKKVIAKKRF